MIEIDHSEHQNNNYAKFNSPTLILIKRGKILAGNKPNILIQLTKIEYAILALFVSSPKKPFSNEEITTYLKKDPTTYKGLCMCINRLQNKFKSATQGEKLFRSVRNNGYRLTQKLEPENE